MAKTAIVLNATEMTSGKRLTKTLTDINVNATNAQIKSFAQALNGLTTNVYLETNRVDKTNCDTESGGGSGGGDTSGGVGQPEVFTTKAYNTSDQSIATVTITKYTYEQAQAALTGADLATLEEAHAEYLDLENVTRIGFWWLAGSFSNAAGDDNYVPIPILSIASNVDVTVNGNAMEVVSIDTPDCLYYAKVTELNGAFAVTTY